MRCRKPPTPASTSSSATTTNARPASRSPMPMINPNRLDESEIGAAHGHVAAVGMAFLLGVALLRELRSRGYFAATARAQAHRPARHRRAGHGRRCRAPEDAQPRLRHPGPQGHGGAAQHRPRRAGRGGAAGQAADLPRPRLRAGATDQRRRPGRQIRPWRAPADLDRSGGSADHRRRTRPPQRGAAGDRNAGHRTGR